MTREHRLPPLMGAVLAAAAVGVCAAPAADPAPFRLLDDRPKTVILTGGHLMAGNGNSWMVEVLRKFYPPGRCPLEIQVSGEGERGPKATTTTGETWAAKLAPRVARAKDAGNPVVVLSQIPTTFAAAMRSKPITVPDDTDRIAAGADMLESYGRLLLKSGADLVVLSDYPHFDGHQIIPDVSAASHDWRAFAELERRKVPGVVWGPHTHERTRDALGPLYERLGDRLKDKEKRVPEAANAAGLAVVRHAWVEWLCRHVGVDVPAWSRADLDKAFAHPTLK